MATMTMNELFAELPTDIQSDINNMYHRDLPFLKELEDVQKLLVEYTLYREYFGANEFDDFCRYYDENDGDWDEADTTRIRLFLYGPDGDPEEEDSLDYLPDNLRAFVTLWDERIYERQEREDNDNDEWCECTSCNRLLKHMKSFFKNDDIVCVYCYEIDTPFNYDEYKQMLSTKTGEEMLEMLTDIGEREKQVILDVLSERPDEG